MKTLIFLSIIFAVGAQAAPSFTYNEVILSRTIGSRAGINFTGYVTSELWCLKVGSRLEFGAFQVAKDLEKIENGLYRCKGQFTKLPFDEINAFKIDQCEVVDAVELQKDCK